MGGAQWSGPEATEGSESLQRDQNMAIVRKNFNKDPKKGDQVPGGEQTSPVHTPRGLLPASCSRAWTRQSQGLLRGEERTEPTNAPYLHRSAWLLRPSSNFCGAYCLPREGQKIDQMMEAFACGYCRCHPGIIQSTDAYYVLSFTRDNAEHQPSQSQHLEQARPGALCGHEPAQQVGWDLPKELIWNF